ncbi:MAG: hypothetical protein IJY94_07255 [Clostridia bacterium]|nr:hypothetical protein [Clostridia bacterium]
MKSIKKITSVFLSVLITVSTLSFLGIRTHAASATGVYGGIAPSVMTSVIDDMEDDFESDPEADTETDLNIDLQDDTYDWAPSIGTCTSMVEMTEAPYSPYEGSSSLLCLVGEVAANKKVTILKRSVTLTETSDYKSITATFFIPKESGGASVTMRLIGSGGTVTDTKSIDAGKWQTVFFDTKGLNRGTAARLEFSFRTKNACDLYILADCIGGCKDEGDIHSSRYLTDAFVTNGCYAEYDRNLTVSLDGEKPYIEAHHVVDASFGDGVGLRVDLINRTSCRSLTLKYKAEYAFEHEITLELPDSDEEVTLLFKIPEEKIRSFSLHFNGGQTGDVEIISIGPSPCFEELSGSGRITECRIARDLKNVSVKGSIDLFDVEKVMLYALMPNEDNSNISNLREPLAEARVHNGEFSFTVPLDKSGEGIFKKYIVAFESAEGLEVVCEPGYVNNPELLATERTSLPESKKGIRPLPDNYVLYGIAQTALDIEMSELFASENTETVSHTAGNATHLFSKEYLEALDGKMKEYEREGIAVRFVLKLKVGSGVIEYPNATGENPAFNTETAEGIEALRTVTDLLVRRYGSSGGKTDNLVGIVLGASVNDAYNNYNLGYVTLQEFSREYSIALRTVYNASVSVTSGFEVSLPLGGIWNGGTVVGQKGSFDARSALEAVSDCITAGGDINWKLAYDITPEKGKYAFEELSPDLGALAERITASNLEVLTEFFSLDPFLYNGASRSILLLGNGEVRAESEDEERSLTADYIYTFLRISERAMKNVSGYIPSHSADYKGTLAYVGTDLFEEKADFASELIGKERFLALSESGAVTDRSYLEAGSGSTLPDSIKGESVIFNLKKKNMLKPSLNCLSAESGVSYGDRSDWGRIQYGEAEGEALRGVLLTSKYPLDLSEAPYISFDLIVSSLPEGVDSVRVTVALYSKKNIAVASTSLPVDGESKVVCNMSGFTHLSSCDRIGIYVTGENGESIGEPMMLISSVKAHSETLSSEKLSSKINALAGKSDTVSVYAVINLAVIATASLAALVIRIIKRNYRSKIKADEDQ